jgi:hypothetical protein
MNGSDLDGTKSNAHELWKRLNQNPARRVDVVKEFFNERDEAGDREGADYALLIFTIETENDAREKTTQHMIHKKTSPLLTLISVLSFLFGLLFALIGIWLVKLGATGTTEINVLGNTAKSTNVGIVSIFLGAIIILLVIRPVIKVLGSAPK